MRRFLILFILPCISLGVELYLSPRYVTWEEFYRGERLLKEKGWVVGVGLRHEAKPLVVGGELYAGTLDYDGRTQTGVPVETDTDYRGLSLYVGVARDFARWLEGALLYSLEAWERDINSTSLATGYVERWFYHTLDLRLKLSAGVGDHRAYLFGAYRFMIEDARMQADIAGMPLLRPKRGPAYEVGAGLSANKLVVEALFSYIRFNESEEEPFGSGVVLQPESVRKSYTVRVGYLF
ncbi:MAG TPA: hypothetical protein EYP11_02575 [Aquificaceae bacterium]|nr:hypothetical protein [Aquificaceae bacterium]